MVNIYKNPYLVETRINKFQKNQNDRKLSKKRKKTMSMVGHVDWTKVETRESSASSSSGGDTTYINFSPGKFKVRLIGKSHFYLQTFIPKKLTGTEKDIAIISPGDDNDPLIKLKILPQQKCAMNVLHRNDENKHKVMRFGASIFQHIKNYAVEAGIDPTDLKKGIDFLITVEDPGGNPRNRKYSVTPLNCTPITKEEAAKIKENGGLYELEKLFSPTPVEKINEYISKYNLAEKVAKANGESIEFEDGAALSSSKKSSSSGGESESSGDDDDDDDVYNF